MPFTHQYVTTTGRVNLCCIADYANDLGTVGDLETQWRDPELQRVRARMLADKPEPRCTLCYSQGTGSDRVAHNTRYAELYPDMQLNELTGNDTDHPYWMDLRPGRLCNLKCRMCFSDVSSAIYDEIVANPHLADIVGDTPRDISDWLEDPVALESVKRLIPHVRTLKLAGGEPLFMPGVLKLLRWMTEEGYTSVHLDITTNGTRLQGKTFKLLEHFEHIDIQFSMCGTGATNDYIRSGADWRQLDGAYNSYCEQEGIRVNIMATVQLYNIHTLHHLIDYWRTHNSGFLLFNPVNYPQDLSIDLLPQEDRQAVAEVLAGYEKFLTPHSRLGEIISRLERNLPNNVDELRTTWCKRTQALDTVRNTRVQDVHPKLGEYYETWNNSTS